MSLSKDLKIEWIFKDKVKEKGVSDIDLVLTVL